MDIDPKEKVTKVAANKTQLSTIHNPKMKILIKSLDSVANLLDIKAQVATLKEYRRNVYLQVKLKNYRKKSIGLSSIDGFFTKKAMGFTKNK